METKLASFRTTVLRRQKICGAIVCCILLCTLAMHQSSIHIELPIPDFIRGFQAGLFVGLELVLAIYIGKMRKALRSEEALRALYVAEHDERSASIRLHTFAASGVFSLGLLAFAALVAGFFNETVCLTLVVTLIVLAAVKLPFKLYFCKKF